MTRDPLWRAVRLLEVDPRRVARCRRRGRRRPGQRRRAGRRSPAWLIARAAQMPPGRGRCRWRPSRSASSASPEACCATSSAWPRTTSRCGAWPRCGCGSTSGSPSVSPAGLLALRRGDLLARVGADVDAVGDVVVRGLLPMAVAAVVGLGSAVAMAVFLPAAGLALLACLLLAGVVAPWSPGAAARSVERDAAAGRADLAAVSQTPARRRRRAHRRGSRRRRASPSCAPPTPGSRGPPTAAPDPPPSRRRCGPAATGPRRARGPAARHPCGHLRHARRRSSSRWSCSRRSRCSRPPSVAAGRGRALLRSREAARRVVELLDATRRPRRGPDAAATADRVEPDLPTGPDAPLLEARGLAVGWPDGPALLSDLDLALAPGRSVAVVGPSGLGKTTLLLTLAGLLPPRAGGWWSGGGGRPAERRHGGRQGRPDRRGRARVRHHGAGEPAGGPRRRRRGRRPRDVPRGRPRHRGSTASRTAWTPGSARTPHGSPAASAAACSSRGPCSPPRPLLLLDEPTEHLDAGGARPAHRAAGRLARRRAGPSWSSRTGSPGWRRPAR